MPTLTAATADLIGFTVNSPASVSLRTARDNAGSIRVLQKCGFHVTGEDRARYCDAQATRYRKSHFLTTHDDAVEGKDRLFAYVLNFTRDWRPDWGGELLFFDEAGHVAAGFTPTFNALNIFRVPQPHAVSFVAPFAQAPRLSITGWIRMKPG